MTENEHEPTESAATPVRRSLPRKLVRWTFHGVCFLLAMVGLGTILWSLFLGQAVVVFGAMSPTLEGDNWEEGDRYIYENITYQLRKPQRWELIVYRNELGDLLTKRVVALPGERIRITRPGEIYINDKRVEPPEYLSFLRYYVYGNLMEDQAPYQCTDGYYVMGDHKRDIDDSRFNGQITPDRIVGRPWIITRPTERRGWVR